MSVLMVIVTEGVMLVMIMLVVRLMVVMIKTMISLFTSPSIQI